MQVLFGQSVLLFLGVSLPVVDSLLAALVETGMVIHLAKTERPRCHRSKFYIGIYHTCGVICLN